MRDITVIVKELRRRGYVVKKGGRANHWKVYRNGHLISVMAATPTDHRAIKNIKKYLKRQGVIL
jgi:tRNA splicing endonuclease